MVAGWTFSAPIALFHRPSSILDHFAQGALLCIAGHGTTTMGAHVDIAVSSHAVFFFVCMLFRLEAKDEGVMTVFFGEREQDHTSYPVMFEVKSDPREKS